MQAAQAAIRDTCAEPGTEYRESRHALLERMPILGAVPTVGAARLARRVVRVLGPVDVLGPVCHAPHPRLFQYAANTCADST
ncbi:hypothetical protein B0G69_1220 [Paraburkholderia sp. RAU2J]|nr:hypothetical protein B0G69_1220 [Paraburkholderia sp. RAU2J]